MIPAIHYFSRLIRQTLHRRATIRTLILPATLAFIAVLSIPEVWATAAATTTTLTVTSAGSDVTSVAAGTVVTLTATVVSGSTLVNPGQVKFCDASAKYCEDSALLATAQLTTARVATYKFRPGVGSHSYQAVFVGTNSYAKSTSTAADLTVTLAGKYPTTTTIASSGGIGNYTLTATVTGTAGVPLSLTGDVSFPDTSNANASLGTATWGTATSVETFSTRSAAGVGTIPYSVATGDFNGDGIPDLATANNPDNTVTVLLGIGDGTFTLKSSPSVGNTPVSITAGDFNGDGIPDLAVANSGDNTVTVLLGNGDGTFATKSTLAVGKGPDSITMGDFNGDGILDLAVANGGDNTVSVLLAKGDGTFTLKSSPAVGNDPTSVAVADFNEDGILDLAVSNNTDSTVTVLLGKGDGTFTLKSSPSTGYNPVAIAVGDFNGDGIPDLVTAEFTNITDDLLTVLLGKGDGTFTTAQQISGSYGSYADCVAVSDLNGDGIPDLITCQGSPAMTIFLGNGDGTFTFMSSNPVLAVPSSVAVADFNGDGSPDLVAAEKINAGEVTVLLNQYTQTATTTLSNVSVSGVETHQIEASYPGDSAFNGSVSSTVPLLAAQINTSLSLSSSTSTLIAGNQVALTATLNPYSLGPFTTNGETITFYSGGKSIGTGTLSAGVATLTIATLPVGSDSLTASYPGDVNFSNSTSNTVTVTVSQVPTTLQLYSNPNPSAQGGQVTLTALISPTYSGNFTIAGEAVSFYNGGTSIGSAPLSFGGVATLTVSTLPNGIDKLTASYTSDGIFASATSNTVSQAVGVTFPPIPNFIVTVKTDTTAGVASNCTSAPAMNCSLRDALAAAFANGSGNITFSPTVFATAQIISLGNAGGLSIPPYTTITGSTTGSGASLTNLVTVNGGGPVFTVGSYVTDAVISNLTITGGSAGGIFNGGALVVSGCTISGNSGSFSIFLVSGGGIENYGTLTLIDSTVAGNSVTVAGTNEGTTGQGGGIDNQGTLTIINSSVVGNSVAGYAYAGISNAAVFGGGINNNGKLTMTNSIVAGNSATAIVEPGALGDAGARGGGIQGGLTGANNIISANTTNGSEDDCDGSGCPTNGVTGNVIGPGVQLAPLGSYGGPTQTMPPLPGSPAICAGVIADIPSGVTTDQRGFPRTTTYSSNPPCVDSGSVQTNYSLSFSTEPPSTIPATTSFTAAAQVNESGNIFPVSGISIPIALATGDNGSLNVSSITTNSSGIAANDQFQISAPGNDTLVAALPITAAGITPAATASATSTAINVTQSSGVQVTVGVSPSGLTFMVDGVSYTATTTLVWPLGSQHTLSAISPQGTAGTQYTFASWSDGGAITHTATASTATINYTVTFNTSYLLTTSANPSQGGTVSPASAYFPANSSVLLTATANPGYTFTSWTGSLVSNVPTIAIAMTGPESVTANFTTIPIYTVNTNLDDSTGTAANCSSGSKSQCSLRDALAAAVATTSGADIEFDPTVFAASQPASARTIVLGSAGTLNISGNGNTRIFGPTTGSGATLTQLVTINGKNLSSSPIFSTGGGVVLSGLAITGANNGGAISNTVALTVIDCMISGNSAGQGGGINNLGGLTVMGSTISGNSSYAGGGISNSYGSLTVIDSVIAGNSGGGILSGGFEPGVDAGTVTIINSTITGNSGTAIVAQGGIYQNVPPQSLTIANSTISGNTGGGVNVQQGLDLNSNNPIPVALTVTDSVLSGNTTSGSEDDCDAHGTTCPASGQNGNFVGSGALLAPLANYGGPTQTQPPLPGSPAICTGVIADIPSQTTTDQRGFPRTTTYGSNPPCVDSGSVQTDYSLRFSTEPPAIVALDVAFASAVQLNESGSPFPVSGINIPLALGKGSTGALTGNTAATDSSGTADYTSLLINAIGSGYTLVATLPLTAQGITPVLAVAATSSKFDVSNPAATPVISPSAGTYTSAQSVTITDTTSGTTIYYTTNGTTPTAASTKYTSSITVSSTETIEAIAVASSYANSAVASATYTITPPAAPPIFTPGAGTYTSAQTVTITDATADATIYYTINGTTPTTASTKYAGAITVSATETIEAIAVATGYANSPVTSATFTIAAGKAAALQFIPVTPCRIVDTRWPTGPFGGPEMAAGTTRAFNIPQSACGIPSTAVAYSLNVTAVPTAALNYLTLWPTGESQPYVSTLNSDGRIKANAAITPVGTNGGVSVYVTDATNVILDIDGYFVSAGTASALAFYPVTPCRVVDTEWPAGSLGGPSIAGGSSRSFPVQSSNCDIPPTAKAYSLNVTAVPHKTLNYLTSWPTGETQPYVSTLNSSTGAVTANAAVVPAGTSGAVSIFVSDDADVILDVNGYFAPPATGGLSLYTVTPCRVIDTRSGAGAFNGVLAVDVETSSCAPPSTAQGYVLNATVVPPGSLDYLTLWPAGEAQPYVSTLNALDGAITSNMAIVPTTNGSVDAFSSNLTNLILDLSSYFAP